MQIRHFATALFATALLGLACQAQTLYGIVNLGGSANVKLHKIDVANADLDAGVLVTSPGNTITGAQALTADPANGRLWAVVQFSGAEGRSLVTIEPTTGVATPVGLLSNKLSSLSFWVDGNLYGVSGNGGVPSETLYRVSLTDASLTLITALGNGADGEVIASHPSGKMYHASGNGDAFFETIDMVLRTATTLGHQSSEVFGMCWHPLLGQMFMSDINSNLYTVDLATGNRTLVGTMSDQLIGDMRGFAYVGRTSPSCQPSDIADDQGNPLSLGIPNVPNTGVNEGDYNCFFQNYFNGCP